MNKIERVDQSTADLMQATGVAARKAAAVLALASTETKNAALKHAAAAIRRDAKLILEANAKDLAKAKTGDRPSSFIDRLTLDEKSVEAIAAGLEEVAALPDPVGAILAEWTRPNGLRFQRKRVPIGVIGIIYESRPNVTADAGALCLKSGNAAILRGGSESHLSSLAIQACLAEGLKKAGLPEAAIQSVTTTDREAVGLMLKGLDGNIDLIVPRGGKNLVARVQDEARVPVFAHLEGICHTYVDRAADLAMAKTILVNAKMRRTGVCGATECLLIDKAAPANYRVELIKALLDAGCEVRGDAPAVEADARVKLAAESDYGHGIPRRRHRRQNSRRCRRCHRAHRSLRLAAHRCDHHRRCRDGRNLPRPRRQRHRALERLDAVRRRRRVRLRRRDRHRDGQAARSRPRRPRAAHHVQVCRSG